jgi:hypothetical protein
MTMASHTDGIDSLPRYVRDPVRTPAEQLALSNQIQAAREQAMREKYGPAKLLSRDLSKDIKREMQRHAPGKKAANLDEVRKAAKSGKRLFADVSSTCFESLSWVADPDGDGSSGTITGTFYHGPGDATYSGPCDLEDFIDATSGSLGEAYAAEKWF